MGIVQLEQIIQRDDIPSDAKQIIREILLEYSQEPTSQEDNQYKTVIDSLDHPFYVIDTSDYQIKTMNTAAKQLYSGYEESIECFALTHRFSKPCSFEGEFCPLEEVKRTKKSVVVEHQHQNSEGNIRILELTSHPVFNNEGNVIQIIVNEFDITERKRAERALQESEERLRSFMETSPDNFLLLNEDLNLIEINEAALTRFPPGTKKEVLLGKNLIELSPDVEKTGRHEQYKEVLRTGEPFYIEEFIPHPKFGKRIISLKAFKAGEGLGIIATDITHIKQVEKTIRHRLEVEQVMSEISRNFVNTSLEEIDEGINNALKEIAEFAGATRSSLLIYSEDLKTVTNTHEWCDDLEDSQIKLLQNIPSTTFGYYWELLKKKDNVIINTRLDLPPEAKGEWQWIKKHGWRSLLFVPLVLEGKLYGTLGLYGEIGEERQWPDDLVYLLTFVANIVANTFKRKKTEQSLQESEKRLRSFVDSSTDRFLLFDSELNLIDCNELTMTGFQRRGMTNVIGKNILELDPIIEKTTRYKQYLEVLKTGAPLNIEYFVPSPKFGQIHLSLKVFKVNDGLGMIISDITVEYLAKQALKGSEERLRAFMDSATDAIELWDSSLNLVECNQALIDEFPEATKKEDLIGKNILDLIPDLKETGRYNQYLEVIRTGNPLFLESFTSHPKFGDKYFSVKAFKVGEGLGMVNRDVTDQKQTEKALQESRQRLRDLVDSATDSIALWDSNFNLVDCNTAMLEILPEGTTKENILGKNLADFDPRMIERGVYSQFSDVIRTGKSLTLEGRTPYLKQSGQNLFVNAFKVGDGLGTITSNITERKRMEEALRESEIKYRSLVERANDGIAIVSDYKLAFINQQFAQMLGYTVEEIINTPYKRITHPEATSEINSRYQSRMFGESVPSIYETKLMKKNGVPIDVEFNVGLITYQGKSATLTFVRDITERKKMEKARQDLDNRRSGFVSMTSHELRTPITVIKGYTEFLEKNLENLDVIRKSQAIESISRNIKRLERLIRGVADITLMEQGIFDLNSSLISFSKFLKTSVQPYQELYGEKFSIQGSIESESPIFLNIDDDRIRQVLDNLLDNANKHTPDDGRIVLTPVVLSDTIQISISDTGVGIDPNNLERIFEQFVSIETDRASGGTGIGLYVSKAICEAHRGTLTAHSEGKNQGATFVVELPRWFEEQT
ncbi:MAG: PAS domain S-box protein [Candidatus Hodarchaeales archaeon]